MTWSPGWNSADSVRFWSHFWFWFGIACLFVAGACEVISHIYGLRKDAIVAHELVVLADRVADQEATHRAEVGAPQKELEQPNASVTEPQKTSTARALTPEQQRTLLAALSPYAGQKVRVDTVMGSEDRLALAKDFVEIFRTANWDVDPISPLQVAYKKPPIGLEPTINQAGRVPPAFPVLVDTLAVLGLGASTGFADEQTPAGVIDMKIGVRANPTEK
jgi:hypothetical protein